VWAEENFLRDAEVVVSLMIPSSKDKVKLNQ
jgi:hypothetical protein